MHPSPRSLIRVTFTSVCVLTLTAVTAGVSVAQGSSSGSTGSSALSGSSGQGSANAPGSAALNPSNPYSEDTTDNLVTFGDSFTTNTHSVANNIESSAEDYPQQSGCHIALDAWPGLLAEDTAARETAVQDIQRNVAERTGVEFIDIREMTLDATCWACAAVSSWPPEPSTVDGPSGSRSTMWDAPTRSRASATSSCDADGAAIVRFSYSVPVKTWDSWEITAVRSGRATVPDVGRWIPAMIDASVVFPAPEAPTTATRSPLAAAKFTSTNAGSASGA